MELKLDEWEDFIYEARPFAYLAIGVYALATEKPNFIVLGLALVLVFCGILVLRMRFMKRKNSSIESLFYESLPFIYMALGLYAMIFLQASHMALACGVVLLFCATKVFHWRIRNRRAIRTTVRSELRQPNEPS